MGNEMNELRYLDLKNTLCEKIYEGVYKDGEKIPSERQLSTYYDVSRITVRKTLELMEKENLTVREVGNGTRVTLKNYGNDNPLDVVALTAPSRNPFFAKFIAEFQKQAWEKDTLLLYVEVPERTSVEDCLYRLYTRNIRNVVIWQDDQAIDREKLLRLRSIGMNLVFFDADDALPYADAVFLDNAAAVRELVESTEFPDSEYLYVGWDNRSIGNVRKREEAFIENCPEGKVVRIPWRRDRKIDEASMERVKEKIVRMPSGMIVCGAGEIAQRFAETLWGTEEQKEDYVIGSIDDFDGSERYPVRIYVQDLKESAKKIYQRLEEQSELGSGWKAESYQIRGILKEKNKKKG